MAVLAIALAFLGYYFVFAALFFGIFAIFLATLARKRGSHGIAMIMGLSWGIIITVVTVTMIFLEYFAE